MHHINDPGPTSQRVLTVCALVCVGVQEAPLLFISAVLVWSYTNGWKWTPVERPGETRRKQHIPPESSYQSEAGGLQSPTQTVHLENKSQPAGSANMQQDCSCGSESFYLFKVFILFITNSSLQSFCYEWYGINYSSAWSLGIECCKFTSSCQL